MDHPNMVHAAGFGLRRCLSPVSRFSVAVPPACPLAGFLAGRQLHISGDQIS
jgi:hypothetical protein